MSTHVGVFPSGWLEAVAGLGAAVAVYGGGRVSPRDGGGGAVAGSRVGAGGSDLPVDGELEAAHEQDEGSEQQSGRANCVSGAAVVVAAGKSFASVATTTMVARKSPVS
jgi:hypothetical protein